MRLSGRGAAMIFTRRLRLTNYLNIALDTEIDFPVVTTPAA